jgi:hypothetical protein
MASISTLGNPIISGSDPRPFHNAAPLIPDSAVGNYKRSLGQPFRGEGCFTGLRRRNPAHFPAVADKATTREQNPGDAENQGEKSHYCRPFNRCGDGIDEDAEYDTREDYGDPGFDSPALERVGRFGSSLARLRERIAKNFVSQSIHVAYFPGFSSVMVSLHDTEIGGEQNGHPRPISFIVSKQCFEPLTAPGYFPADYFVLSALAVPLSRKGS